MRLPRAGGGSDCPGATRRPFDLGKIGRTRRRALELLAPSPNGLTEAMMRGREAGGCIRSPGKAALWPTCDGPPSRLGSKAARQRKPPALDLQKISPLRLRDAGSFGYAPRLGGTAVALVETKIFGHRA
jgi:hypothetical protein